VPRAGAAAGSTRRAEPRERAAYADDRHGTRRYGGAAVIDAIDARARFECYRTECAE